MVADIIVSAYFSRRGPGLDTTIDGTVENPVAVVEICHGARMSGESDVIARTAFSRGTRGAIMSQCVQVSVELGKSPDGGARRCRNGGWEEVDV